MVSRAGGTSSVMPLWRPTFCVFSFPSSPFSRCPVFPLSQFGIACVLCPWPAGPKRLESLDYILGLSPEPPGKLCRPPNLSVHSNPWPPSES